MPTHHRRHPLISHAGEVHVPKNAHHLTHRARAEALPGHLAASEFESAFRPSLFVEDQRDLLVAMALELDVVTTSYDLHRVPSSSIYERVQQAIREERVLFMPAGVKGVDSFDFSAHTEAELEAADVEIKRMRRCLGGLLDSTGKFPFVVCKHGHWISRAEDYLQHRDAFIGPGTSYDGYRALARIELDANNAALRARLEPAVGKPRDNNGDWREAQVDFYAWVRRSYERRLGSGADIPAVIRAGTSAELRAALQQVRLKAGMQFKAGGFNPRPMKTPGGYRLGTLSDHALGTAVDIDSTTNLQIKPGWWSDLTAYVGTSLDVATRRRLWKSSPEELHRRIQVLNDSFVAKLTGAIAAEDAKPHVAAGSSLATVIHGDSHLLKIGVPTVMRWRNGFFSLHWSLVRELHAAGFLWGATFATVDLHHFQLGDA